MHKLEAKAIVGKQPRWALRNMARALQMQSWRNTGEQWRRLRALKTLGYKVRYTSAELVKWESEAPYVAT
jgi:hypothetical protein